MYLNTYFHLISREEKWQMKTATISGGRPVWLSIADVFRNLNLSKIEMELRLFIFAS